MVSIPDEIRNKKQWSYSFSETEPKRPKHTAYKPDGGLTFVEATQHAERLGDKILTGFYVTKEDPYVLGDIDHVENPDDPFAELPPEIAFLLKTKQTYCEISPSGKGLRFILKFISKDIKNKLQGNYFLTKEKQSERTKKQIQINIGSPWMTITSNATSFAKNAIATVSLDELEKCFALKHIAPAPATITTEAKASSDRITIPTFNQLQNAVMSLPMDQNPRIQRAYAKTFSSEYDHYDYWMKVMMGLHHYALLSPNDSIHCLELLISWSRLDPVAFTGEEDVHKHWLSLNKNNHNIIVTFKSVLSLAYYNTLIWPILAKQKQEDIDRGIPRKPLITEYVNFKALIDFYDIKLYRDESNLNVVYLTGDADIIEDKFMLHRVKLYYDKFYGPYDEKTLVPGFHIFLQQQGFVGIMHVRVREFIKNLLAETKNTINLIKLYFDTPFAELPKEYQENGRNYEKSTFERLFKCLTIRPITNNHDAEYELYWKYYKCWLMGITRTLYYKGPYRMNNCILLLTGPEQIRKTSHFLNLLPRFMRDKIALTTHGFQTESSMRDLVKLSANNLMLVWDEIEQYLNAQTESNFKKLIDNNPQKFIDKYEVTERLITPMAIYGATSNQRHFKLGDEGSRRIFHIPVKWVDVKAMEKLCWHNIINEIKDEMLLGLKRGDLPWLLDETDLKIQSKLHSHIRTKTNIDVVLEEVYDFDSTIEYTSVGGIRGVSSFQNDRTGTFKSVTAILNDLGSHGHDRFSIKRTALIKSLERLCGTYTKTERTKRYLQQPLCEIYKGLATQGKVKYWTMPPLRRNLAREVFAHVTGSLT